MQNCSTLVIPAPDGQVEAHTDRICGTRAASKAECESVKCGEAGGRVQSCKMPQQAALDKRPISPPH